jgi:hypothetical protein
MEVIALWHMVCAKYLLFNFHHHCYSGSSLLSEYETIRDGLQICSKQIYRWGACALEKDGEYYNSII